MQTHFNVPSLILVFQVVYNCYSITKCKIGFYTKTKTQRMIQFIIHLKSTSINYYAKKNTDWASYRYFHISARHCVGYLLFISECRTGTSFHRE